MNHFTLFEQEPYNQGQSDKDIMLLSVMKELVMHHYSQSKQYKGMLDGIGFNPNEITRIEEIPFIPVQLFKLKELRSVLESEVFKTMTSSGTTGQAVSKIFLDKETALNQSKILSKIVTSFLGQQRSRMLIVDSESVLKDRMLFSARGAGILGFSIFGSKRCFALDNDMKFKLDEVTKFLQEAKGEPIFVFGFTFLIYQYLIEFLKNENIHLNLSNATIIHGGGWKKLTDKAISAEQFKKQLNRYTGVTRVHDYYGMVEQTGTIYMECEYGYLHAPIYSDIVVRRKSDLKAAEIGEIGIIQVLSSLPKSYPGHSLLTEDEGVIKGIDTCLCGRKGKYFNVIGRLKNAEIRGCSDTVERIG